MPFVHGMAHEWEWAQQNNITLAQNIHLDEPRNTLHDSNADDRVEGEEGQEWERISDDGSPALYPESEDPSEESIPEVEQAVHNNDAPTPPINVPISTNGITRRGKFVTGTRTSTYDSGSLEKYMRSRRTSISFDPKVKTDDGNQVSLGTQPPKLSIKTRPRGKSLLDEIAAKRDNRAMKAHSETDRTEYDPVTGERLDASKEGARDGRYTANQPRWPLLQSTVDSLAIDSPSKQADQSTSLTSHITASPSAESQAPSNSLFTLLTSYSPSRTDWFTSGSQDSPRRFNSRSKSYNSERRSLSRRVSQRVTTNSPSPASAFLRKYTVSPPSSALPPPDSEGQEIRDYVLGRQIGFGGFSIIREAFTLAGKERIHRAVKIVRHQDTGKEEAENESLQLAFEHEIDLWRCLSHAHILPLNDIYFTPYATFAFMKLTTGGTLFDLVRTNRGGISPRLTRRYAGQLASALRYLHEDMRIVHRDLKLENCLLDMSPLDSAETGGSLLLCDFGLADYLMSADGSSSSPSSHSAQRHYAPSGTGYNPRTPSSPKFPSIGPSDTSTSLAGSLPYAAPELLEAKEVALSTKADIWAFGVICFALVMGKLPFTHAYSPMVSAMILRGEWDMEGLRLKDMEEGQTEQTVISNSGDVGFEHPTINGVHGSNSLQITTNESSVGSTNSAQKEPIILTPPSEPELFLSGVSEFVENCLVRQPHHRWDISACLSSRWLEVENEAYDDVKAWGSDAN